MAAVGESLSPTGRAGSGILPRAVLPKQVPLRRMPDRQPTAAPSATESRLMP